MMLFRCLRVLYTLFTCIIRCLRVLYTMIFARSQHRRRLSPSRLRSCRAIFKGKVTQKSPECQILLPVPPSRSASLLAPEVIEPLYNRASAIIEDVRAKAYRQINESLVKRNWEPGQIIAEEELNGEDRAKYGASVIKELSKRLTATYSKGFSKSYLYSFVQFYKTHPAIFQSAIGKSANLLSWTDGFCPRHG